MIFCEWPWLLYGQYSIILACLSSKLIGVVQMSKWETLFVRTAALRRYYQQPHLWLGERILELGVDIDWLASIILGSTPINSARWLARWRVWFVAESNLSIKTRCIIAKERWLCCCSVGVICGKLEKGFVVSTCHHESTTRHEFSYDVLQIIQHLNLIFDSEIRKERPKKGGSQQNRMV